MRSSRLRGRQPGQRVLDVKLNRLALELGPVLGGGVHLLPRPLRCLQVGDLLQSSASQRPTRTPTGSERRASWLDGLRLRTRERPVVAWSSGVQPAALARRVTRTYSSLGVRVGVECGLPDRIRTATPEDDSNRIVPYSARLVVRPGRRSGLSAHRHELPLSRSAPSPALPRLLGHILGLPAPPCTGRSRSRDTNLALGSLLPLDLASAVTLLPALQLCGVSQMGMRSRLAPFPFVPYGH